MSELGNRLTDRLTDVTIEGLRGVGRVELRFVPGQRVYTLFGVNGVGKTKCLEALYQFLLAPNKDFENFARRLRHDFQNPWPVMARMHDAANEVTFETPTPTTGAFLQVWGGKSASSHSLPVIFLGAGHRASLDEKSANSMDMGSVEDRRKAYFTELYQALHSCHLSSLGMAGDVRRWLIMRAQSVNPYQKARDNRQVEVDAVLSMLHEVEPLIDPKSLQIDGAGKVFLDVEGQSRELGELSSGFAALLKMIQAIVAGYAAFTNEKQLQRVRGIVLIDEIDVHLHAEWQAKIIPCLKSLLPNTTFYIATHSPLVLAQLQEGEAYLLERSETDGVVRSQVIDSPNRRLFVDVLENALGVDLNKLKLESLENDNQAEAKQKLLSLLRAQRETAA